MKAPPSAPRACWILKLSTNALKKPEDCRNVMTTGSVNVKLMCRSGLSTSLKSLHHGSAYCVMKWSRGLEVSLSLEALTFVRGNSVVL